MQYTWTDLLYTENFLIIYSLSEVKTKQENVRKILSLGCWLVVGQWKREADRNAINSSKHISKSVQSLHRFITFILMHGFSRVKILRNDMILCVYDNTITKVITCFNPFIPFHSLNSWCVRNGQINTVWIEMCFTFGLKIFFFCFLLAKINLE